MKGKREKKKVKFKQQSKKLLKSKFIMNDFYKKGVTAIEMLMIACVLALLFAVVLPQFSKIKETQVIKNAVSEVLTSLNKAQFQTLASVSSSVYGVHFQADC